MYLKYYRRQMMKSIIIIFLLLLFAIVSTYFIYNKFTRQREKDIDTGKMEVVFHSKEGNIININKFNPVSDAVGLASTAYNFTVKNSSTNKVFYKVLLEPNEKVITKDNCSLNQIPTELLKLSLRNGNNAPSALVLSEFTDNILYEGVLEPLTSENYSIRIWAMNSNFLVDKNSHFHAIIRVVEE